MQMRGRDVAQYSGTQAWWDQTSRGLKKKTHKIDIWVVDRSLLQAEVENDDERMSQVAGEADVGQRSPETARQEGVDKTCSNNDNEQRLLIKV